MDIDAQRMCTAWRSNEVWAFEPTSKEKLATAIRSPTPRTYFTLCSGTAQELFLLSKVCCWQVVLRGFAVWGRAPRSCPRRREWGNPCLLSFWLVSIRTNRVTTKRVPGRNRSRSTSSLRKKTIYQAQPMGQATPSK